MGSECKRKDEVVSHGKVRAVTRALDLLERLSTSLRGLKLSELARAEGLPAATCLRLLTTMQDRGFVRFDASTGYWTVGATALYVGTNFAATRRIMRAAEPVVRHLSSNRCVNVNLGALDGNTVAFFYRATPNGPAGRPPHERTWIPVHCSAIGKAILSGLPPLEAQAVLGTGRLVRVTRKSLVERRLLLADVEKAQRSRYAVDDEENTHGLRCVAAPIFNEYQRPIAAISIAAPVCELSDDHIAMFGRELVCAADRITASFGGHHPSM